MMEFDATNAQCLVYSFKDGLFSKLAHDLRHRVTRFSLLIDEKSRAIQARLDASSLRVECVLKDGLETDRVLSEDDRRKIQEHISGDVLRADHHPLIKFRSTAVMPRSQGYYIQGLIEINDRTRPMSTLARRIDGNYVADLTIHQPAFAITPFSVMMGTVRVKLDVVVRMVVPSP